MINDISITRIEKPLADQATGGSISGVGLPTGGAQGQFLVKNSNSNYDTIWQDLPSSQSTEYLIQTVYNGTGSTINRGNIVSFIGGDGSYPIVEKAVSNNIHDSDVIGLAIDNILNGEYGSIIVNGILDGINTLNFEVGDKLYLSPITDGAIINYPPTAPDHAVFIGFCIKKDSIDGAIYVSLNPGTHLDLLHDVNINLPSSGDVLFFNENGIWVNKKLDTYSISGLATSGDLSGYYLNSNPSGFITGVDLSNYAENSDIFNSAVEWTVNHTLADGTRYLAGDLVYSNGKVYKANYDNESLPVTDALYWTDLGPGYRLNIDGRDIPNIPQVDVSNLYPNDNPSGFITGVENVVYTTGDQAISGKKTFLEGLEVGTGNISTLYVIPGSIGINNESPQGALDVSGSALFSERPTVNGTGVLLQGEIQSNTIISGVVYSAQVNVKNGEGRTIYKGQPVYINGANGTNIIVGLASNTGEATSSKTLGLVVQDTLENNAFGTVITEGLLQGFNASAASAGDPIWLGPTGSLIYGLANKPYAPNHLVYLGVVTRAQNNGELFVKVQNGYELDELHDVNVTGVSSGEFLFRNNNLWSGKSLSISDVSELGTSLDSKQITGNYYTSNNPSGFITGISQFNYISGDLTGSLLSPSLSYIQGNAVSAASPSAGQTLQWNGTAWVPGSVPNGGNGGGGLAYYFNFANTSGITPVSGLPTSPVAPSQLGRNYSVGSGSITSTDLIQGSYSLICGFVTPATDPGVTDIPAGLWDFNIWCDILGGTLNSNQTQFQIRVYKYNSTTQVYTSIANSDDVFVYDPITIAQYIGNVTMPQTTILATDRIYVELWAQKNLNQTRQIRFYFDSLHPSHVHTTIPSVAGNGIVKVVNGVMQSPASLIFNADISSSAAIDQSKLNLANASADGSTKGISAFNSSDFNSSTGIISLDYSNGQSASSSRNGFLSSSDWSKFNQKVESNTSGISGAAQLTNIVQITYDAYSAIITPTPNTLYIIIG